MVSVSPWQFGPSRPVSADTEDALSSPDPLTYAARTVHNEAVANAPTIPIRVDVAMLARFDHIAETLSERAHGIRVSRSEVMRMAFDRGLPLLETEIGIGEKPKRGKR